MQSRETLVLTLLIKTLPAGAVAQGWLKCSYLCEPPGEWLARWRAGQLPGTGCCLEVRKVGVFTIGKGC